jgi:hypothetical protein
MKIKFTSVSIVAPSRVKVEMEDEFKVNVEEFSFSNNDDGYERLHDEEMDQISVSVHSDCEGIFAKCSQTNLIENGKMKISLSQEQLKLNSIKTNFLTVPTTSKKARSLSFSVGSIKTPNSESISYDMLKIEPIPSSSSVSEIIYAVPQKPKKVSIDDECMIETMTAPSTPEVTFRHPLKFYCKICNNIFNDPRTLNCLHSFCCQCLAQLDAANNLQNNQFWRKISDVSSELFHLVAIMIYLIQFKSSRSITFKH